MPKKEGTILVDNKGRRNDGRAIDELRPIKMQVNVLTRADGSAYVEMGGNKVLAAVYGPREIHPRHLSIPDRTRVRALYRMATFSVDDRKRPAPGRREHELSKVITEALTPAVFVESFPRTAIDIYIEVIQADGGTRCASINAASLALADAGIPMRDLVVSVAVGKIDGKVVLDLDNIEDQQGEADIPIAAMYRSKQITLFQMDGRMSSEEIKEGYDLFLKGSEELNRLQREALHAEFGSQGITDSEAESETDEEEGSEKEKKTKKEKEPSDDTEESKQESEDSPQEGQDDIDEEEK